jgi:hypothetical protein
MRCFAAALSCHRTSRPCLSPVNHPDLADRAMVWRATGFGDDFVDNVAPRSNYLKHCRTVLRV